MNEDANINGRTGLNIPICMMQLIFHILAVVALFNFTWSGLISAIIMWWIAGSLGIGMGYHRLLTHRGFGTPKLIRYFLAACGTLAIQGGPISWVAVHRIHHKYSDQDGDPHSPREGFWWAHMGWLLNGESHHREINKLSSHVNDLLKEPFLVWLTKWHFIPISLHVLVLFAIGGWNMVLWGLCVRVVFSWHATFFVNSATHLWGSRRFNTRDDSRNNWWVALMSHGEGWHNNHHAHPASARHGIAWYEIDVNWYGIWVLKKLGLAQNIRLTTMPKKQQVIDHTGPLKEAA